MTPPNTSFSFLFRTEEGEISQSTWWRGVFILGVPLFIGTLIWLFVSPYTHRTMSSASRLIDPVVLGAFLYLLIYAVGVLLAGISFYNLSAKRLRACGLATGVAGLVPLMALFAGAAHWIVPRSENGVPLWAAWCVDALLLAAIAYTVWVLGLRKQAP